jgi:hypothetical protein
MKTYIGTKIIRATPMTRLSYNGWRGWTVPENENPEDDGYLVEYTDGGKPNHPAFAGYVSWSPKEQFENAYQEINGMSFGVAVEALKLGERVARSSWAGKNVCIRYVPASTEPTNVVAVSTEGTRVDFSAHLVIDFPDGLTAFWSPGMEDVLADDWELL